MRLPKITPELVRKWKLWNRSHKNLKDSFCNITVCLKCEYYVPEADGEKSCRLYCGHKYKDMEFVNQKEHYRVTNKLRDNLEMI